MDGINLYQTFLQSHQPQLVASGVPRIFWETVHKKLSHEIFDAGTMFQLMKIDYSEDPKKSEDPVWMLSSRSSILRDDPNNIFLVDHAWTYDISHARQNLRNLPALLERMSAMMDYDADKDGDEIEFVLKEMWRYNQCFSLNSGSIEDRMPLWYIMDEVGSAINHDDMPNFRAVPFLYLSEGITYTLLFPIQNVESDSQITRDFLEGQTNDLQKRSALLMPWSHKSFIEEKFTQVEPDESYFLSGHIRETLPDYTDPEKLKRDAGTKLKVFSQYVFVNQYLTDPAFEITESEDEADILWFSSHFKEYKDFSISRPRAFINQFPFENVLTIKDLLSIVCRRKAERGESCNMKTLETFPKWLPTTYNLSTELVEFVSYFQNRETRALDNHWICKPWNLARGLDTHVTSNLFHILRLPSTGPKIAQKYISNPVLYNRPDVGKVKFDVRYVVMLKSVKPLKAYAYKNFFLRFANKPFALNNLDDYEQHFTVMNYSEEATLCHVKCEDFIPEWESQYPDHSWRSSVEPKILSMFRELFEAATASDPPKGIAESSQSRSVYAIDLMFQWDVDEIQPMLLEVNFAPDCKRACEYYQNFYNDIFKCLFLNNNQSQMFHDLCPEECVFCICDNEKWFPANCYGRMLKGKHRTSLALKKLCEEVEPILH